MNMSAEYLLELLRQHEREKGPLFVLHSPELPETSQASIEAARAAHRPVFHVYFAEGEKPNENPR